MNFKPMLSASLDGVDLSTLRYPLLASPKLDGVRCIIWEGVAYSRNAKPIRNRFVQKWVGNKHNLDGELIVGSPTEGLVLNRTQSGVMAFDGEPDFTYYAFDVFEGAYDQTFQSRLQFLEDEMSGEDRISVVPHYTVRNQERLKSFEEKCLNLGYEGVMLRDPNGPYKHGRSTLKEGYLMKLKRFEDGEGVVVALEESRENTNAATTDELGRTKRSTHQENLVGKGMVGTLILEDGSRVAPGTMNHHERTYYWNHQDELVGRTIHWRAFGYGVKDKPRFRRYYGIREDV